MPIFLPTVNNVRKGGTALTELLTWGLPIFAALALFGLSYNAVQTASSVSDYWMAQFWFLFGAAIPIIRLMVWAITTNRPLLFRTTVCFVVIGTLAAVSAQQLRSISQKRESWARSHAVPPSSAETPKTDLRPKIERKGTRGFRLPIDTETNRVMSSRFKGEKHNFVAQLAKFYYAPEPDTPDWVAITAHVILFYAGSFEGKPIYTALRPVWFETYSNKQIFKRAESHELIVAATYPQCIASYESTDKEGEFRSEAVIEYNTWVKVDLIIERDGFVSRSSYYYSLLGESGSIRMEEI